MRRLLPLLAAAAAGAGAAIARRRSGAGGPAPAIDASPTAADPAERAAAAQATPPGPAPAPPPEPGSAAAALQGEPDAPQAPAGEPQTVGLYVLHEGERSERARAALAEALGAGATLGPADGVGRFDVTLTAPSREAAEQQVRAAFATSGTGDDFTVVTTTAGRELPADDPRQPD
jgi:hypothetical protein